MSELSEAQTTSFYCPAPLLDKVLNYVEKVSRVTKAKISKTAFFTESVWFYLDYLEKKSEDEVIDILSRADEYSGTKRVLNSYRTRKVLIENIDGLLAYVAQKTGGDREIAKAGFFVKAADWYLKELHNRDTERTIEGILAEGRKNESIHKKPSGQNDSPEHDEVKG